MVDDWLIKTMYATKRRRRTVKSVKTPVKDPPKSNPSKRHRERLNSELDHLASLLPFEQSVISKLDKLSILRLAVSYLRTKSYFQSVLPDRYNIESHHLIGRSHLFPDPTFSEGDSILQALYGFLFVVTCDGEVFYASRTVEQYLGFHQSDIIHQSVMELIHSEDREEFKRQLTWNSALPQEKNTTTLHEAMMPENYHHMHRSFTVRFRCLLDNTSGFITLEISGWIRVLHGQNSRSEEPQLALFATCCPFGPLSLLDLPSRELTFKSKHKMDFSPMSVDSRGKMMFNFTDRELATKSGYDLIHPDDLSYFAAAHQELIKTGSSGLIAYRWQTKDLQWLWLQSSCKVIYKNSKPDFVICTHRQLTEDEGQDLFHKRGNEFKLPYPLLDLDICTGFDFPNDDMVSKMKSGKKCKQKNNPAASPSRDFIPAQGRKRKMICRENGLINYPQYNGYEGADFKPDLFYSYPASNIGLESADLYRSHAYSASFPGTMYPSADTYRIDGDKHAYTNGYYLDPHRQYQHTLSYHGNGYADLMSGPTKYGYDMSNYRLESYSIDLAKKVHYGEDFNDFRKYAYDYGGDRLPSRLNGSLEPVDLRSSSMYNGGGLVNGVDGMVPHHSCLTASPLFKADLHGQNLPPKDSKVIGSPTGSSHGNQGMTSSTHYHHSSVIKNAGSSPRGLPSRSSSADHLSSPGSSSYGPRVNMNSSSGAWTQCSKAGQMINSSPNSTPHSDVSCSPKQNSMGGGKSDLMPASSPVSGATPASVIHNTNKTPPLSRCDSQPMVGGIPVPVVKSGWMPQVQNSGMYGHEVKDPWALNNGNMMDLCHQKYTRGVITDTLPKVAIL